MIYSRIISRILLCLLLISAYSGNVAAEPPLAVEKKINVAGWSDSPYLTPDGKRLYFMYSRWNFYPIFSGGLPVLQGPDRLGLHKHETVSEAFYESDIYVAERQTDGSFSTPLAMPFNQPGGDASGMQTESAFYYIHTPPGQSLPDIYVARFADGRWSAGQPVPGINTDFIEDNPHVSPGEDGMWFSSTRPGGYGSKDIYFSSKVNGVWTPPVNVGPTINTAEDEDQPWINLATGEMYFNRGMSIYRAVWKDEHFSTPRKFDIPGFGMAAEISFTSDMNIAVFASPDVSAKRIVIYSMTRQPDGNWSRPAPVD